jgi:hypothetical protein
LSTKPTNTINTTLDKVTTPCNKQHGYEIEMKIDRNVLLMKPITIATKHTFVYISCNKGRHDV